MSFFLKYVIPVIAIGLFAIAIRHVWQTENPNEPVAVAPHREPPSSPFPECVAGAGIVEPQTQNISIGSPVAGIVRQVDVVVGDRVTAGQSLFQLDDRQHRAQVTIREAAVTSATADLERLTRLPRPEEVPLREAAVTQALATRDSRRRDYARIESLGADQAATVSDLDAARTALTVAQAELDRAEADLKLLRAGTWVYEEAVARAAVARSQAELQDTQTELERLTVRAAVDGEVLQVNVRPGEFVGAPSGEALIVLGNTQRLHVRADIDEHDIPRFNSTAEAVALLHGYPDLQYRLKFQRVEPYVIPKRSLTGQSTERIDTRVLQVIYAIETEQSGLFVGQQLDVFINANGGHTPATDMRSNVTGAPRI